MPHAACANPANRFHVVMRVMPGTQPFAGAVGSAVWQLLLTEQERGVVNVFAACLMPDHLHVVCGAGTRSVIRWVNGFKSFTTRTSWGHGSRTALWQPGFYDRGLRDGDYERVVAYIANNPVEAKLVAQPEDWPWTWVAEGGA